MSLKPGSKRVIPVCCLIVPLIVLLSFGTAPGEEVLSIGTQKQLFIDDYIVGSMQPGVFRILNQPLKYAGNPVIEMDRCWEANLYFSKCNVIYDEEEKLFKMWNHVVNYDWSENLLGYYTSKDGISWKKPLHGQFDYHSPDCEGEPARNHNFVFGDSAVIGKSADIESGVFKDSHERDPQKIYKMLYRRRIPERGTWAAYSPDGIHWTDYPYPEVNPVFLSNDTHQVVFWDERRAKYVAHIRLWPPVFKDHPVMSVRREGRVRAPGIASSDDFVHWDAPASMNAPVQVNKKYILVAPDEKDAPATRGFYTMEVLQYEGVYIGFLSPYNTYPGMEGKMPPTGGNAQSPWIDKINTQLAFSRDGWNWQREAERRPFMENGPEHYDAGMIYVAQQPIAREDLGEIWIYYVGFRKGHWSVNRGENQSSSICLAKLRLDGFVSLTGGKGFATTKALTFEGDRLRINAHTAGDEGAVYVEILDPDTDQPLAGYSEDDCDVFRGNAISHTLAWQGEVDLSKLTGKPVKLRFHLERAKLFSFQFYQGE